MQIDGIDPHFGNRALRHRRLQGRLHRRHRPGRVRSQSLPQRLLHQRFALPRRQVQQPRILLVRPGRVLGRQRVVSQAKSARRKQLLPIAILGKRSRLPHQPVDDVPIVDPVLVPAPQPRHSLDQLLGIPDFQVLGIQPGFDLLADQPARHRVAVALHVDQTPLVHATGLPPARFQPTRRQRPQHRQFLGQSRTPPGVELLLQPLEPAGVLATVGEIPAAPQHQRLVRRFLETPMPLLDVAVFVGVVRLDLLAHHPVMGQQRLIALREFFLARSVAHRQTHPIRPMPRRHAAQFRQGGLQPFAQALEALREADRGRLPVRVGQDEVIDQMLERLARNRHAQLVHVREVGSGQSARFMLLGEEDLLGRSVQGPPAPDVPLQRPQLAVGEAARMPPLQFLKDGLALQAGLVLQEDADLLPDVGEGIGPLHPVMGPGQFAGQLALPPILPCRLLVHVCPQCRRRQRLALDQQAEQFAYLFVRDHRKPPGMKNLRFNVHGVRPGILIVVAWMFVQVERTDNCRCRRNCRPGILIVVEGRNSCR